MNIDDVFHSFWNLQSFDIFDFEFRDKFSSLSTLRRIFRMTFVVVARLIEERANQRAFVESNSKKKSIRRRDIFLNKRKSIARKSLNVFQTLHLILDAIFEQIIEYLFRKIDLIDELNNTLVTTHKTVTMTSYKSWSWRLIVDWSVFKFHFCKSTRKLIV